MKMRVSGAKICSFLLLIFVMFSISAFSVSANTKIPENGWYKTETGKKYYYKNGKAVKGWKKIDGYWYQFKKSGALSINCIVLDRDGKKYRYVGKDGVVVKDAVVQKAVNLVMEHTSLDKTRRQRLKEIYLYLKKNSKYTAGHYNLTTDLVRKCANFYLGTLRGECCSSSCGFAYIAMVLGFDVRICYLSYHVWDEIPTGSKWYTYDLSREFNHHFSNRSWFKLTRQKVGTYHSGRPKLFSPTAKKGTITWHRSRDSK